MRILLTIHHRLDPDSGAPGSTVALGETFRGLGHEVRYLSFDDMPGGLGHRAASLPFPYFVAARLRGEARRGLDVIDASSGDAWVWGSLPRPAKRPLLVTRSHGLEHPRHEREVEWARREGRRLRRRYHLYQGGWRLYEVRQSLRTADLVLVLNDGDRIYAEERLGIAPDRIRLTANGLPGWYLDSARSTNVISGNTAIAFVGGYRMMKGVEYGSRALASVMRARPALTVSFLGTAAPRDRVLSDFPAALHDRITTVERYRRDELPDLLEGHGIMLFPSLSEGFSVALLESMACGLTPIATPLDGTMRLVSDQHNGLLVPLHDSSAISAAILRLLGDPALLRHLQVEARRTTSEFSWSSIGAQTLDLYREGLARRQSLGSGQ
jgi:glycosyltransferase involved in cell wall biosynthesis